MKNKTNKKVLRTIFFISLAATAALVSGCEVTTQSSAPETSASQATEASNVQTAAPETETKPEESDDTPSDAPEHYTEDVENELCLDDGTIIKLSDLEVDPTADGSDGSAKYYIMSGSITGYEYEPFDDNSVKNPANYDLKNQLYLNAERDEYYNNGYLLNKKTTIKDGDKIGDKGLEIDAVTMSIQPHIFYSETLNKKISSGYDIMDGTVKLKGTVELKGILYEDRYSANKPGSEDAEQWGAGHSEVWFMPYSEEYHNAVPYIFDLPGIKNTFLPFTAIYNYQNVSSNPQYAISTSNPPIYLGEFENGKFTTDAHSANEESDVIKADYFTDEAFIKEATLTLSDLTYTFTERGGASQLSAYAVKAENVSELK